MKKLNTIYVLLLCASFFMVSCSSDKNSAPDEPLGIYDNGLFVLNEGGTSPSSSSVTFIGNTGTVEQNVFGTVNPGAFGMGTYLQDMFFDATRAFIISGSANKITVVDRYTFQFIATVDTNFSNPRYGAVINGKAYVTNSADFFIGTDDFLTVIDLSNYATSKVPLGDWSEKVIEDSGKLYVSNGYFGSGSSISVFNPANNTIEKVIALGYTPNSLKKENGMLYVLGSTKLTKINLATNTIVGTPLSLPVGQTDAKNLAIDNNTLYYTVGTGVYKMAITATAAPQQPLFSYVSGSDFGAMYGFAVHDNHIYIGDGGDFISSSYMLDYSTAGVLNATHTVGVAPNGFYFNE